MASNKSPKLESREKIRKKMMWVAWAVIIIFVFSCFIIGGLTPGRKKNAKNTVKKAVQQQNPAAREIEYLEEQVRANPNDSVLLANLAYQYQQVQKLDKAVEFYKKSLELDPEDTFAIHHLAQTYFLQNKYDSAIELWNKAIQLEPDNSEYYLGLAVVYIKDKNFYQATDVVNKAIKADPGNLTAYEILASVYDKMGEKSKAIAALQQALEIAKIKGDSQAQEHFKGSISQIKK